MNPACSIVYINRNKKENREVESLNVLEWLTDCCICDNI